MNRRDALKAVFIVVSSTRARVPAPAVSTLIGTGSPGFSDREVNNPYGLTIGPDRALYFCDLDNQRIRRLDLKTRQTTAIAGNGQKSVQRRWRTGGQRVVEHAARHPVRLRREPLHRRARQPRRAEGGCEDGRHLHRRGNRRRGILRGRWSGRTSAAAATAQHCRRSWGPAPDLRCRQSPDPTAGFVERHDRDLRRYGRTATDAGWRSREARAAKWTSHHRHRSRWYPLSCASRGERNLPHRAKDGDDSSCGGHWRTGLFGGRRAGAYGQARRPQGSRSRRWKPVCGRYGKPRHSPHRSSRPASSRPCSAPVSGETAQSRIRFDARCRGRTACSWMRPASLYVGDSEAHRIRIVN